MNKLALIALSGLFLFGCADINPAADTAEVGTEEQALVPSSALIGVWQFELGDERRAAIHADLEAKIKDPAELSKAKAEVEDEARASELEFDGHTFYSRVFGKEILKASYTATSVSSSSLLLSQTDGATTKSTTVRFADADTLIVNDPKKGELTFHRVAAKG